MEYTMIETLYDVLYEPFRKAIYRRRRYDVFCSVGLFQTVYAHDTRMIKNYIRQTDSAIEISPTTSAIIYDYTDIHNAKYAFTNLINTFIHQSCDPVVAYTEVYDSDRDPETVIRRLYEILREAMREERRLWDDRSVLEHGSSYRVDFSDIIG